MNLTPANILTASFLYNLADTNRNGLSILNPAETTTNIRQTTYMSTIRDQHYFGGALLDVGFADTRGLLRNPPQGIVLYEITPSGNRGNYFSGVNRHWYRQQAMANLFLPTVHFRGDASLEIRHGCGAGEPFTSRWRCTITRCCAPMVRWRGW